jgi:ribose transport system ATP-binding protein
MREIRKAFGEVEVLHGVNFDLRAGEIHAVVGENGAGKSTLFKVLSGVYSDHSGRIALDGAEVRFASVREALAAGIAVIHQELNLVPELTAAENIWLGREPRRWGLTLHSRRMNDRARQVLRELGSAVDPRQPVSDLRIGARQIVEIAKAISLDARVLVMDEPTSALSEPEIEHLFAVVRRLAARGVGIVYISHRLDDVFKLADHVTVMRDGADVTTAAVADTTREDLIRLMVGRRLESFFTRHEKPRQNVVLSVSGLRMHASDFRGRPVLDGIGFEVRAGEILGIAGLLGAGRSELLESLFGAHGARAAGRIRLDARAVSLRRPRDAIAHGIALVTEDRKLTGLVMGLSLRHNISLAALRRVLSRGLLSARLERALAQRYISRLAIRCRAEDQDVATLSGGNQQKAVLGKWLAAGPRVLLLDEPTRGIDVGAKSEIYRLLAELADGGCAIVMASSELPELLNLCDRILVLREGRVSGVFDRENVTQERILEAAAPMRAEEGSPGQSGKKGVVNLRHEFAC